MIHESFKQLILPVLQQTLPGYLFDKWNRERPTILLSEITWNSPVTESKSGWQGLKNFDGEITLLLYSDKNKQLDPFPLIEKIISPLTKSLNNNILPNKLDCEYKWYFYRQREFFSEMTYEIQLIGELDGTLFKKK
jgi:hypothetical protein